MNFSLERYLISFSIPSTFLLPSIMLLMIHKMPCLNFHVEGERINGKHKINNICYHGKKIRIEKNEIKLCIKLV